MSLVASMIQNELKTIKPEDIEKMVLPGVKNVLMQAGSQDLDHDGQPDFKEAMAAAQEVADGLTKLAKLVQAYHLKFSGMV